MDNYEKNQEPNLFSGDKEESSDNQQEIIIQEEKNAFHKDYEERKKRYEQERKTFASAEETYQQYLRTKEEEILKQTPPPNIETLVERITSIMPLESLVDLGFYTYQKERPSIKIQPTWFEKIIYFLSLEKQKTYAAIAFKHLTTLNQYSIVEQFLDQAMRQCQKKIQYLDNLLEKDKEEFEQAYKELYKQREMLSLLKDATHAYSEEIKEDQKKIQGYKTKLKKGADPKLEEEIFKLELKIKTKYNQLENLKNDAENLRFKIKSWKNRYHEKDEKYTLHMKQRTNFQATYNLLEFYAEIFRNQKEDQMTAITPEDFDEQLYAINLFKEYLHYQTNTKKQQELIEQQHKKLQEIYHHQPITAKNNQERRKDPELYVQEIMDIVSEVDRIALE